MNTISSTQWKQTLTGGVYLSVVSWRTCFPHSRGQAFMQSFKRKSRLCDLMARIPIHIIVSEVGITGAAAYGLANSKAEGKTRCQCK